MMCKEDWFASSHSHTSFCYECLISVGKATKVGLVNGLDKGGISWSQLDGKEGKVVIEVACISCIFLGAKDEDHSLFDTMHK